MLHEYFTKQDVIIVLIVVSSSKNLPNNGDTISITKLIIIWERGYAVESALKPRIDTMNIGVAICITPGNTAKITEYARHSEEADWDF
jgi:hypothetical protein